MWFLCFVLVLLKIALLHPALSHADRKMHKIKVRFIDLLVNKDLCDIASTLEDARREPR